MIAGTRGPQRATMKLDIDGKITIEECEGNGPVDAIFNCIKAHGAARGGAASSTRCTR